MLRPVCLALLSVIALPACTARAETIRVASFNVAMGLAEAGELKRRLEAGNDPALRDLAAVLQTVRPDVVLLNEFDHDPDHPLPDWLRDNYLAVSQGGRAPIAYSHSYRAPVNTGAPSGLDLNDDGATDGPADAWGFGHFPGQYGMLVLSRLPIESVRTFRDFRWQDMPGALRPVREDGSDYYPDATWAQLRLSSKSHWDLSLQTGTGQILHLLASHPTPPSFDGPEDRNGRRNHDEIRFWIDYIEPGAGDYLYDDEGVHGGLPADALFVIVGDLNADPFDGNSLPGSIDRLLDHPRVDTTCTPASEGGPAVARAQGQANLGHRGDPAHDTGDFSDARLGNLRADYALPSAGLRVTGCGVFWPLPGSADARITAFSDHHLVWVDLEFEGSNGE